MLTCVVCEREATQRERWMEKLRELIKELGAGRAELLPMDAEGVRRVLRDSSAILLVVLYVNGDANGKFDEELKLADEIMSHNRDSYVLLDVWGMHKLGEILRRFMRPAGVLIEPCSDNDVSEALTRVLKDYRQLKEDDSENSSLVIETAGGVHRIPWRDITYLEAADKLLNICTKRNVISARITLSTVEKKIPKEFLRCHRAYIVNSVYVQQLDGMELKLTTGERLPVARSCKSEFKERFAEVAL